MEDGASDATRANPRLTRGLAWLKVVAIVVLIGFVVRSCFTITYWDTYRDPAFKLFSDVVGSIGVLVILGGVAFVLGWLAGGKNKPDDRSEVQELDSKTALQHSSSSSSAIPISSQQDTTMAANLEEEFWAKALAEYESGARRPGLYARVFSQAQGNEAIAKASYLKHRVEELSLDHQQRVRAQEQAEREAIEKARLARLAEEERAYELLPKGHCPGCDAMIPMSAEECPKCRAFFGTGSAWKILPIKDV